MQQGKGAVELPLVGGLITLEELKAGRGIRQGTESAGRAVCGVLRRIHQVVRLGLDEGGLVFPGSELTPAGDGHGFELSLLHNIAGLEEGDEVLEKIVKLAAVFFVQHDGVGEHPVAGGIE